MTKAGLPGRSAGFLGWLALAAAMSVQAQMSVPPATYPPALVRKDAPAATFVLSRHAPARAIVLAPPTAAEAAAPKSRSAAPRSDSPRRNKGGRLAVGFARTVPPAQSVVALSALPWQRAADGTRAAQLTLASPTAAAVRLAVMLRDAPPGLTVRFQGSDPGAQVFGPYTAAEIAGAAPYWSPVLEGDTATLEISLPDGTSADAAELALPQVSHLVAAGRSLRAFDSNIGTAGACEVDIACLAPVQQQELASATNAVARMLVTISGVTYLCSGTLLNDSVNSLTPWYLTADHCLEDTDDPAVGRGTAAASAGSINTYWFYQAAACGSVAVPNYVVLAGGARLLARSVDFDWALVQLNAPAPKGTTFAAWSADGPLAAGTPADAIHHPSGDLKKWSEGKVLGYRTFGDNSSYIEMTWTRGVTEPGSSGSGLFTRNAAAGWYEVRGTLTGGASACDLQSGTDYYGRFDIAFPLVAQYLAPNAANPGRTTPVVEYYNAAQDSYFITVDPFEIAGRDNGVPAGWVRTGYRFLAYTDPAVAPAAARPVCRLYAPPPYGDTRFHSASAGECAAMLADPAQHWIRESDAAFYIEVPSAATGACPATTRPVYRFADNASPQRRRYTAEVDLRDAILSDGGWTQEGTGPAPARAAMCAPTTGPVAPAAAGANYEGLWWNAPGGSESGWGINFAHQGDTLFATWYTFDVDGAPLWMVVAAPKTASGSYSGTLYRGTGPAFSAVSFDPAKVAGVPAGTATFSFSDPDKGTFAYNVGGTAQVKSITRQVFATPVPTCTWGGTTDLSLATNYQGIWWNAPAGSESGWGVNLTHQGNTIFATWFTFAANGRPLWLAATAVPTGAGTYAGMLYTGTGPPFNAVPFDPAKVVGKPVGELRLAFADGNHATFAYTVDGISQSKSITREIFAAPGTVCR